MYQSLQSSHLLVANGLTIKVQSYRFGLLLAPLLLDLLSLFGLSFLLLDSLAFSLLPILFCLREVSLIPHFFLQVDALSPIMLTISVVLPCGPSQSLRLICGPFLSVPFLRFSSSYTVF